MKYIVKTNTNVEDTIKLFKISKKRVKHINELVDKIVGERIMRPSEQDQLELDKLAKGNLAILEDILAHITNGKSPRKYIVNDISYGAISLTDLSLLYKIYKNILAENYKTMTNDLESLDKNLISKNIQDILFKYIKQSDILGIGSGQSF